MFLCVYPASACWLRIQGVLTFALISWVASQGVAIVTFFAAITEKAICVVDALEALAAVPVAVAHGVGVDVVVAVARPARSPLTIDALWVTEESVVAQLTAFP